MTGRSGRSESVWINTDAREMGNYLGSDASAEVCVVGAGIAGLSTAYMLARESRSVVVLEDGLIGGGETSRTTAHLSYALDDGYVEVERLHGREGARLAAESHRAAVDCIEAIVLREGIDCDFRRLDGYLFAPPDGTVEELERERDAALRAGLADVDFVSHAPIPGFHTGRSLRFPRQGQFHPMKYLHALAEAFERLGGRLYTGTHAASLSGSSPMRVETSGGPVVTAGAVVMATNAPVWDSYGLYSAQSAYRSYVIGARMPAGSVTPALYWDTSDPYHYVRLQAGAEGEPDLLIVGGEDHKTGQADDYDERFTRLEAWARERFPIGEVAYRWSGQVMEPVDGMAFIGRYPLSQGSLYVATGDSGHGMTHGTIAGMLLTDLIAGRSNEWSRLYDPSRITAGALSEYADENINVLAQYSDWLTEADIDSSDQIAPRSGATIRRGAQKVALYRDENGAYHEFSAICPHLGCIVSWNDTEKTWDCPCHGSRFSCLGKVLDGPANRNLDTRQDYSALISAASLGLRTATLLSANALRKLLTFGIRTGF